MELGTWNSSVWNSLTFRDRPLSSLLLCLSGPAGGREASARPAWPRRPIRPASLIKLILFESLSKVKSLAAPGRRNSFKIRGLNHWQPWIISLPSERAVSDFLAGKAFSSFSLANFDVYAFSYTNIAYMYLYDGDSHLRCTKNCTYCMER